MNDQELKSFIKEALEPVLDSFVDVLFSLAKNIQNSFPKDIPMEQRSEILNTVLKNHADYLSQSIKSVVPEDLTEKLKEVLHGR